MNSVFFFFFQVSKEELAKLVAGFEKTDLLTSGGVTLAGQRYIYLSGTDRVIRAKFGKVGVHCMKTTQGELFCCHKVLISLAQTTH
jgi:Profilin